MAFIITKNVNLNYSTTDPATFFTVHAHPTNITVTAIASALPIRTITVTILAATFAFLTVTDTVVAFKKRAFRVHIAAGSTNIVLRINFKSLPVAVAPLFHFPLKHIPHTGW